MRTSIQIISIIILTLAFLPACSGRSQKAGGTKKVDSSAGESEDEAGLGEDDGSYDDIYGSGDSTNPYDATNTAATTGDAYSQYSNYQSGNNGSNSSAKLMAMMPGMLNLGQSMMQGQMPPLGSVFSMFAPMLMDQGGGGGGYAQQQISPQQAQQLQQQQQQQQQQYQQGPYGP